MCWESKMESSLKNKLWINSIQKKDFFMLFFFLAPIVTVILLNSTLYGGWRHLYFVYPAFIYLVGIGIYYFYSKIREFISNKILFILSILFILHNSYILFKFHPYQNVYQHLFFTIYPGTANLCTNDVAGFAWGITSSINDDPPRYQSC